jgi:Ca2+-dependent lipid-binding protein
LHQAKELDQTKSLSGDLNPFCKVHLNHATSSCFQTHIIKHNNSPVWESAYEFLCTDKHNAVISVKIVDERDFLKDPVIGYMSIKLVDLMEAKQLDNKDWFPLSGCRQGKLRLSAEWKPLAMAGALHGTDQYKPPIGVVRLVLQRATDVKNVEAMLGGKVSRLIWFNEEDLNPEFLSAERPIYPCPSGECNKRKDRGCEQQYARCFSPSHRE